MNSCVRRVPLTILFKVRMTIDQRAMKTTNSTMGTAKRKYPVYPASTTGDTDVVTGICSRTSSLVEPTFYPGSDFGKVSVPVPEPDHI